MFRQTMVHHAKSGESLVVVWVRFACDPVTRRVADTLRCSVDELLVGFGQSERFIVDRGYDHVAARSAVGAIIDRVASAVLGLNDRRIADTFERGKDPSRNSRRRMPW